MKRAIEVIAKVQVADERRSVIGGLLRIVGIVS